MNEHNELLLELWNSLKSHVPVKEEAAFAKTLVTIFNDYDFLHDSILEEEIDKKLSSAIKECLNVEEDELKEYDDDNGFEF